MSENGAVVIYTTRFCPYCIAARRLLQHKEVDYTDIAVDGDTEARARLEQQTGRSTVPQIWVGKIHVGGYDELAMLEKQGELDSLLQQAAGFKGN